MVLSKMRMCKWRLLWNLKPTNIIFRPLPSFKELVNGELEHIMISSGLDD